MRLPPLIPKANGPNGPIEPIGPEPHLVPTPDAWAAVRFEIERLYVHERRRLRFVMRYMEAEHDFKATEQMYKKRFAKWGFLKNSKRSSTAVPASTTEEGYKRPASRKRNSVRHLEPMPASLQLGHEDSLTLRFFTIVREWSVSFYESIGSPNECLACTQQRNPTEPRPEKTKEISSTLKLVSDLLDRGHGTLAGRMARKAFLLVEDILMLEAPVVIWSLLDAMYHMAKLRHVKLFRILLAHLIALTNNRMSKCHPLSAMLYVLRRIVTSPTAVAPITDGFFLTSSSSSPSSSTGSNGTTESCQPSLFSNNITSLLEAAWILNAEMVFNHFDPRFFELYFQLDWEACSIDLPSSVIDTTKQWLRLIESQQICITITEADRAEASPAKNLVEEDRMLQCLLSPRPDASPPQDYKMLRTSSVAALQEYWKPTLSKNCISTSDTAKTLRILPALIKAKILEPSTAVVERSTIPSDQTTKVSRSEAGNVACVIKALMDLSAEQYGYRVESTQGAIERIRYIVALREYAHGAIDPRVTREMWLLEDALAAAGERRKAQEVGQSIVGRLEAYTQDVPLDSV